MTQQAFELHVNPSDETIRVGPLTVRFLVTADDSSVSIAAFVLTVPGGQYLPGAAHSHDHYEETIYGLEEVLTWTVDGKQVEVGPGQALCIPRGAIHRFDNKESRDAKALCAITVHSISANVPRWSMRQAVVDRSKRKWLRLCVATASRQSHLRRIRVGQNQVKDRFFEKDAKTHSRFSKAQSEKSKPAVFRLTLLSPGATASASGFPSASGRFDGDRS
jgi:quercetin dioxygenase-like cupin family protein